MGAALAPEITAQVAILAGDVAAVGAPLGAWILTVAVAGAVLGFLRRRAK